MKVDNGSRSLICVAAGIAVLALLLGQGRANGDTIFDNLQTPDVNVTAGPNGWSALSFVTNASPMTLDSVDVRMLPHAGTGQFVVRLFSNAAPSNDPNIPLETLSGPNTPGFGTFHYTSLVNSYLLPNSPYWIVFSGTGIEHNYGVGAELPQRGIAFGSTIGGKFSVDQGAIWTPSNWIINMRVTGTVVPEPLPITLLGLAAAGTSTTRRRKSVPHNRV